MTMTTNTLPKVGFVGLGHMGGAMAARLIAANYRVLGTRRSRVDAEDLIAQGLGWRDTPGQVAGDSDVLITSLPDDDTLASVADGPDGVLAGLRPGATWVEMSTVSPGVSVLQAGLAQAQHVALLDAPVSGSVPQVRAGTLTIMVGGDEDAYRRVEPVLRELGTPTRVGPNGQGTGGEAGGQHQPRRPDARVRGGTAAGRAVGRGPGGGAAGDGWELDRLADV